MSNLGSQRRAFAPLLVFGVLLTLVIALGAGILLTRPSGEGADPAGSASSPTASATDHQLTDAEAIARLAQLDGVRINALEARDQGLLREVFTADSPAGRRVKRTIQTLRQDKVKLEHRRYEVEQSEVLSNSPDIIRIRQVVVVDVQFRGPRGRIVTRGSGVERQVLVATLKFEDGQWLFHNGRIVATGPVQ